MQKLELDRIAVEIMNPSRTKASIAEVGEQTFETEVLQAEQPVLVEFAAEWSRPCRVLDSVLHEVVSTSAARAKIVRVDADDNPDLSLWFGIRSIPTLLYFLGGKVRARIVGTASKEAILSKLHTISSGEASSLAESVSKPNHDNPP